MKTIELKTNVMCSSCLAKVTPALDEIAGAGNWKIDTNNPDKILTVSTDTTSATELKDALSRAGYTGTELSEGKYVTH